MTKHFSKVLVALAVMASLAGCTKNNDGGSERSDDTGNWISLTAAFPDATGTAGNGGTRAFAVTPEQAADPNYTVRIFDAGQGFILKSSRTARVQGSDDGKFLYNIQYTGADGGVFNKYSVKGGGTYEEVGSELNTAVILGTAPRWTKAAEGIGVGVYAGAATLAYTGTAPNFVYQNRDSEVRIAIMDLNNTAITNTALFNFPWSAEERAAGYGVGRIDVPVLNADKTKLLIGCNVSKVNTAATPTISAAGVPAWPTDNANINGTKTLVLDYPSLRNPKVITSTVSKANNHAYRTMTQYVGTDGHIYQATATSGPDILRISKTTNEYDNTYNFNLNTALGVTNSSVQAWRYLKDGAGIVMYALGGTGGYLAMVDLNAKAASKLATGVETELDFGQFQHIGVHGDNVYIPLTAPGKDGNLFVINWKTKQVTKGARLVNQSGSFYIGAY